MSTTYFDLIFEDNDITYPIEEINIIKTDIEVNHRFIAGLLDGSLFNKALNLFRSKEERIQIKKDDYDEIILRLENIVHDIDVDLAKMDNGESLTGQQAKMALYKLIKIIANSTKSHVLSSNYFALVNKINKPSLGILYVIPGFMSFMTWLRDIRDLFLTVANYRTVLTKYKTALLKLIAEYKRRRNKLQNDL